MAEISAADRQLYRTRHSGKSDFEIRQTMLELAEQAAGMDLSRHDAVIAANALIEEASVLREILEERTQNRDHLKAAKEAWKASLTERRYRSVQRLPISVTPQAQLAAAILEEYGDLTLEELSVLYTEFAEAEDDIFEEGSDTKDPLDAEFGDEAAKAGRAALFGDPGVSGFRTLLTSMVSEGTLRFDARTHRYSLFQFCTETLFPEHPADWAKNKLLGTSLDVSSAPAAFLILDVLDAEQTACSTEELPELVRSYRSTLGDLYPAEIFDEAENYVDFTLRRLLLKGILKRYHQDGEQLYYFPMLGDKDN